MPCVVAEGQMSTGFLIRMYDGLISCNLLRLSSSSYGFTAEKIEMSTHGTTHTDSISHIDPAPGAPSIEKIPFELFFTEAICVDLSHVPPKTSFTVGMIKEAMEKD